MIKYLIMDVDGSLTDGKIYMGQTGEAMKAFSIKDGYAIKHLIAMNGIRPIILTARNSDIVVNRCNELGITEILQGKSNKVESIKEYFREDSFSECAYFGDDIVDLECMKLIKLHGGVVGCPADSATEVKAVADYVCINKAGEGAFREFSEWLIHPESNENLDILIKNAIEYMKQIDISKVELNKSFAVNEGFYYVVQKYSTKKECDCVLESHKKYVDIQLMVSGEEVMDIVDTARLNEKHKYDYEKDVVVWYPPKRMCRTSLKAGDCIVLYPENAHRGAISIDESCNVIKIVGKVLIG